jgi:hypothetical protein
MRTPGIEPGPRVWETPIITVRLCARWPQIKICMALARDLCCITTLPIHFFRCIVTVTSPHSESVHCNYCQSHNN